MMKQSRFRLRNKSYLYLNFTHNWEMIVFLSEQLYLQLFKYLLDRFQSKQSSVARSVLFILVKEKIQSTILESDETAVYDFKPIRELLAATISFCKFSAGLSEITRAQEKLGVFLVRQTRSSQLSLTGGLRALFCCYCEYVLLRGALVYIKP